MGTGNSVRPKSYIYFHYSADVTNEKRQAVRDAVVNLKDKTNKNRSFFAGLHMNVCNNLDDLTEHTSFSKFVKQKKDDENITGAATFPLYNNGIKEIIIKTEKSNSGFLGFFKKDYSNETIYETTLHELGHEFDDYFGQRNPQAENQYKSMNANYQNPKDELAKIIDRTTGLRNSDEFKNAWKKDVNKMKYMPDEEYKKLGYISPNYYSHIDITDGVDDNELEAAELDRGEAFAQLFAYALSNDKNIEEHDKSTILKSYPNTFAVVKSYITKFFGIQF